MDIRLIKEWMGHPVNTVLHVNDFQGGQMIDRKTAVKLEVAASADKPETKGKGLTQPAEDKQMKAPTVKK